MKRSHRWQSPMKRAPLVLAALLGLASAAKAAGAEPAARTVPEFGLMLNEDGDIIFPIAGPDLEATRVKLRRALDPLKASPVKTLVYNIACGSDILHYPTKVGSQWGWRKTTKEQTPPWSGRTGVLRKGANTITLKLGSGSPDGRFATLSELQLGAGSAVKE